MLFKLICLHRNGVALTKEELADAPRYIGNLIIEDWREGSSFERAIR